MRIKTLWITRRPGDDPELSVSVEEGFEDIIPGYFDHQVAVVLEEDTPFRHAKVTISVDDERIKRALELQGESCAPGAVLDLRGEL